jgi:hypothetical protein
MGNYITSCSANGGILNGSMVLDDSTGNVTSYTSSNNGVGTVTNRNPNSTNLNFSVQFNPNPRQYPVVATPNGTGGWRGNGGANPEEAAAEPWTATAVEPDHKPAETAESVC